MKKSPLLPASSWRLRQTQNFHQFQQQCPVQRIWKPFWVKQSEMLTIWLAVHPLKQRNRMAGCTTDWLWPSHFHIAQGCPWMQYCSDEWFRSVWSPWCQLFCWLVLVLRWNSTRQSTDRTPDNHKSVFSSTSSERTILDNVRTMQTWCITIS